MHTLINTSRPAATRRRSPLFLYDVSPEQPGTAPQRTDHVFPALPGKSSADEAGRAACSVRIVRGATAIWLTSSGKQPTIASPASIRLVHVVPQAPRSMPGTIIKENRENES